MTQGQPVRVVVLSSIAHNMPSWQAPRPLVKVDDMHFLRGRKYTPWTAYSQSKLGNIYMAKQLASRCVLLFARCQYLCSHLR